MDDTVKYCFLGNISYKIKWVMKFGCFSHKSWITLIKEGFVYHIWQRHQYNTNEKLLIFVKNDNVHTKVWLVIISWCESMNIRDYLLHQNAYLCCYVLKSNQSFFLITFSWNLVNTIHVHSFFFFNMPTISYLMFCYIAMLKCSCFFF